MPSLKSLKRLAGKTPTRYLDSDLRMGRKLAVAAMGDEYDFMAKGMKSATYQNRRTKANAFQKKLDARKVAPAVESSPRAKYGTSRGTQYAGQTPTPFEGTIPRSTRGRYGGSRSSQYAGQTPRSYKSRERAEREATKRIRKSEVINNALDGVKAESTFFKSIGATGGTLGRSMYKNLSEEGAMGRAFKGTLQTSAISAAASGGLAFLNGDDPWAAAKTGAVRGAMAGAGYQGLKAATHSRAAFGKGGMKQIGRGLKDTYGAHTVAGQSALRNNSQMSSQLKRILMAGKDTRIAQDVLLS